MSAGYVGRGPISEGPTPLLEENGSLHFRVNYALLGFIVKAGIGPRRSVALVMCVLPAERVRPHYAWRDFIVLEATCRHHVRLGRIVQLARSIQWCVSAVPGAT